MVAVLTSGIALGVHVPGVLLANRLRASGVPTTVTVLESLLTAGKRERAEANRAVFHRDFRLARAGHRVVRPPTDDGVYRRHDDWHASFTLVRHAIAVAGKPGGGTLLDSLHAATPLILLDALAPHEEHNARLWLDLGFAVEFRPWFDAGCPLAPLETAHHRLAAARPAVPDFGLRLVEEYAARC